MQNVLVVFGGTAPERDISVITGVLTANALNRDNYQVFPVFIDGDGKWFTGNLLLNLDFYKQKNIAKCNKVTLLAGDSCLYAVKRNKFRPIAEINCAINCLHGVGGEDGVLSAILKASGIAFASPDLFPSALSIDKHFTKLCLKSLDVKYVDYVRIRRDGFFARGESVSRMIGSRLGYPVIVKPANLGSSIGINIAHDEKELFGALCESFNYDCKAVCEKYIENARDMNCAAYFADGKIYVSEVESAISTHDILTFEDKYCGEKTGNGKRDFPADIPESLRDKIRETVKKVYNEFDFSGIVRFDFLVCGVDVYLNEINAVPGSMAYYLFCNKISQFSVLLDELITEAQKKQREIDGRKKEFSSEVLSGNWQSVKK